MRENFQNIDAKKLEIVHEIKYAYDEGKISLEEARKSLKAIAIAYGKISSQNLAERENKKY